MEAIRSFQSEFAHILTVLPILSSHQLVFLPILYHIHRYYTQFSQAKDISMKQKNLLWLNIIEYILILTSYEQTEIKAILTGFISFYFIYEQYPIKKGFSNNFIEDLLIIILGLISIQSTNNYIKFFGIRELTYHLLEIFVYY